MGFIKDFTIVLNHEHCGKKSLLCLKICLHLRDPWDCNINNNHNGLSIMCSLDPCTIQVLQLEKCTEH